MEWVVQYIGKAVDLHGRWKNHHLRLNAKAEQWVIFWKEVDREHFLTKEHEESFWISILKPSHNRCISATSL